MRGESTVNGLGKNAEIIVEKKDYDENYSGENAELNTCTNLRRRISSIPSSLDVSLRSCESLL